MVLFIYVYTRLSGVLFIYVYTNLTGVIHAVILRVYIDLKACLVTFLLPFCFDMYVQTCLVWCHLCCNSDEHIYIVLYGDMSTWFYTSLSESYLYMYIQTWLVCSML